MRMLKMSLLLAMYACAPQNVPAQEYKFTKSPEPWIIGTVQVRNDIRLLNDPGLVNGYFWLSVQTQYGTVTFRYDSTENNPAHPGYNGDPSDTVAVWDKPLVVIVQPDNLVIPEQGTATFTLRLWQGS